MQYSYVAGGFGLIYDGGWGQEVQLVNPKG